MQNRSGNATRHWHGAAATTLTGSLLRFVTGDPATAALGGTRSFADTRAEGEVAPREDVGADIFADCKFSSRAPRHHRPTVAFDVGGEDRSELPFGCVGFQGSAPPERV